MILEITRDNLPAVLMFLASLAAAFGLGYTHAWWKRNTVNDALLAALHAARAYILALRREAIGHTSTPSHRVTQTGAEYYKAMQNAGIDPRTRDQGKETDK